MDFASDLQCLLLSTQFPYYRRFSLHETGYPSKAFKHDFAKHTCVCSLLLPMPYSLWTRPSPLVSWLPVSAEKSWCQGGEEQSTLVRSCLENPLLSKYAPQSTAWFLSSLEIQQLNSRNLAALSAGSGKQQKEIVGMNTLGSGEDVPLSNCFPLLCSALLIPIQFSEGKHVVNHNC
eukprot:1137379-Pelagomonas_calceolata.AAC.11